MLPWKEIGFIGDALFREFEAKISQTPEFQQALFKHFIKDGVDKSIVFQRAEHEYRVNVQDHPQGIFARRNADLSRTPIVGKSARRERTEHLRIDMDPNYKELGEHRPYIEYRTQEGIHEINTQLAVSKAQEIIENF
jgi:hypothetical protein